MIRLNILYPNSPGSRFDLDHYLGAHMSMAKRLYGDVPKEVRLEQGMAGVEPDSPPAYIVSSHMRFESIEAFMQAWSRMGEQLGCDIPNYTDAPPVIQFSRILPFD